MMKLKTMILSSCLSLVLMTAPFAAVSPVINLPDFPKMVEEKAKSVVNISTTSTVRQLPNVVDDPFFELFRQFGFQLPQQQGRKEDRLRERREQSLGSGFIIAEDGYILTNAHVVARADDITVKLPDRRTFKAKVIGSDTRTDIALLKINARGLPPVQIGDAQAAKVGEGVFAIGSPFGLESTVTAGILSAKGRTFPNENYVPFLQTDAAVNPGNSGGPLFNLNGQVIGVNSQIYSQSGGYMGVSFAIPIDEAMKVVAELKTRGKVTHGRIGVSIQRVSDELAKGFGLVKAEGALVAGVEANGPAAKAKIKVGDIIVQVNGVAVLSSEDLPRLIARTKPGTTIPIQVWREKAMHTIRVTVSEWVQQDGRAVDRESEEKSASDPRVRFGLQLAEIPQQQLDRLAIKYGLYVQGVTGSALEAGLRRGDIITGVGADDITSFRDLRQKLARVTPGALIPLRVLREEGSLFFSLQAPK